MTDPWAVQIPEEFLKNPQTSFYFDYLGNVIRDLIATNDEQAETIADLESRITALEP